MISDDTLALLAAIREKPEEDTPRLMLADEVAECGFPGAGDFIRWHVKNDTPEGVTATATTHSGSAIIEYRKLIALLFGTVNESVGFTRARSGFAQFEWVMSERRKCRFRMHRGLPIDVRTTAPMLLEQAPLQFLFPLTSCEVTDRRPQRNDFDGIEWVWHRVYWPQKFNTWEEEANRHELPPQLYNLLPTAAGFRHNGHWHGRGSYPTLELAERDLNAAALIFGQKSLART